MSVQNQISDALWPDAEGDDARHSLKTTVHRLRKLLGNEQVISVDAGKLSLNPQYCWTDVWAFDRLLEPDGGSGVDGVEVTEKMERALQLYKGGSSTRIPRRAGCSGRVSGCAAAICARCRRWVPTMKTTGCGNRPWNVTSAVFARMSWRSPFTSG